MRATDVSALGGLLDWWYDGGKTGMTIDLDGDAGREAYRDLARHADLIIETEAPGRLADLGLDHPDLVEDNPKLVQVSLTPFGRTGPRATWQITDLVAAALGGVLSVSGLPDQPVNPWGWQCYNTAGFLAAVSGLAGYSKEHEISSEDRAEAGERDFSFGKGLAVAIFAGIMSSCFAYGLAAGKPIAEIARVRLLAEHRLDLWQNLPVLVVVLWGGFVTNFVWSLFLILKNRSFAQFGGAPGINPMGAVEVTTAKSLGAEAALLEPADDLTGPRLTGPTLIKNYVLAALAGVIWYFQFFFYSMGQTKMGKYDFSSWTLHMASIIIFATLWGVALKEWKGTSRRTKGLVALGLFLLVGSTVVVGYGNYLKVR